MKTVVALYFFGKPYGLRVIIATVLMKDLRYRGMTCESTADTSRSQDLKPSLFKPKLQLKLRVQGAWFL